MKDRKKIIYTTLILICIISLIAFKVSGSLVHNNQVENQKTYSGVLNSPTLGNWEINNEWADLSTNDNVTINGGNATIHATTNFIEDNELTYKMHVTYEGGSATSDFKKDLLFFGKSINSLF